MASTSSAFEISYTCEYVFLFYFSGGRSKRFDVSMSFLSSKSTRDRRIRKATHQMRVRRPSTLNHHLDDDDGVGHGHALCADSLSTPSLSLIRLDYYCSILHITSPYSLLLCTIISSPSFHISFTISLMPMPVSHAYSIWILAMHLMYYYLDIIHHLCTSTPCNTLDFCYFYLVPTIVPGLLGPLGTLVSGRIDSTLQY